MVLYTISVNSYKGPVHLAGGQVTVQAKADRDSRPARNAAFKAAHDYAVRQGWLQGSTGAGFGIRSVEVRA